MVKYESMMINNVDSRYKNSNDLSTYMCKYTPTYKIISHK